LKCFARQIQHEEPDQPEVAPKKRVSPKVPRAPKNKLTTTFSAGTTNSMQNKQIVIGLANAMHKANQDANFRILKASDQKDGERYWGRRLLLKSEFYNTPPSEVKPEHVLKDGAFGVHEVTTGITYVDLEISRCLVWNSGVRFWNIS
jgi:hypothetical protein